MESRVYAAALRAIVGCFALTAAADIASARSAGFGGRSFSLSSGLSSQSLRPSAAPRALPPRQRELGSHELRRTEPGFRELRRSELGLGLGFGFPLVVTGGSFLYGPYGPGELDGFGEPSPYDEPELATGAIPGPGFPGRPFFAPRLGYPGGPGALPPPALVSPIVLRPGCPAQTVTFPGEDGRERSIDILRC
jgi:hypothetical protein